MSTLKLSEVLALYREKVQRECEATREWRRRAWTHFIDAVTDIPIGDVTYSTFEDYEAYLYGLPNMNTNGIRSYLKAVKRVVSWSAWRKLREGDPASSYKVPERVENEVHIFSEAQMCDLIAAAHTNRWRALIGTALRAALRRGEALNLRIEDVDFDKRTIAIQPHKATPVSWPWTPKNYKRRVLRLTDDVSALFCKIMADEIPTHQPYLMLTEKQYWIRNREWQTGEYVTGKRRGQKIPAHTRELHCKTPDIGFDGAFGRIRDRANVVGQYHEIRKTCLTEWSRHVPPQTLHKWAGHRSFETTLLYYLGDDKAAFDVVDNITFGATGLEPATS